MKTRKTIEIELAGKRERLELYLKREAEMLSGGVQSYAGRCADWEGDLAPEWRLLCNCNTCHWRMYKTSD